MAVIEISGRHSCALRSFRVLAEGKNRLGRTVRVSVESGITEMTARWYTTTPDAVPMEILTPLFEEDADEYPVSDVKILMEQEELDETNCVA